MDTIWVNMKTQGNTYIRYMVTSCSDCALSIMLLKQETYIGIGNEKFFNIPMHINGVKQVTVKIAFTIDFITFQKKLAGDKAVE